MPKKKKPQAPPSPAENINATTVGFEFFGLPRIANPDKSASQSLTKAESLTGQLAAAMLVKKGKLTPKDQAYIKRLARELLS